MENEQNRTDGPMLDRLPTEPAPPVRARRSLVAMGLALFALASLAGGYALLRWLPANGSAHELADGDSSPAIGSHDTGRPQLLFLGWGQRAPDLALILSGQMHGYMDPCGCSYPQHGGLVRRQAFIDGLRAKGWDVAGIDLGELAPSTGIRRQQALKLEYSMKALDGMGYRAVGMGKTEMAMPLTDALAEYSLNSPSPRSVVSSIADIDKKGQHYFDLNARRFEVFDGGPRAPQMPRIGVLSLTGPDLIKAFEAGKITGDKNMRFLNNRAQVLPAIFKAFVAQKVEAAVLLYHDYPPGNQFVMDKARQQTARLCAQAWAAERKKNPAIPPLIVMMILSEESEPPSVMHQVPGTPTHIVEIGHKGKYVGVVGVFRQGNELRLKYELVLMEPKYQPAPGQKNAALAVMEEYARNVKTEDLLGKFIRSAHPIQIDPTVQKKYGGSRFVGSDRCGDCHAREYEIWAKANARPGEKHHSRAFAELVKAKNPSLRQYDPECVICHTVGFRHPEGYNQLPVALAGDLKARNAPPAMVAARLAKHNKQLENVGCESCHGPGSAHTINPQDLHVRKLMNPYRPSDAEQKLVQAMLQPGNPQAAQARQDAQLLFTRRMARLDEFCQKCHDDQNDVTWHNVDFLRKWVDGGIVHNSPTNPGNHFLPRRAPAAQAGAKTKK